MPVNLDKNEREDLIEYSLVALLFIAIAVLVVFPVRDLDTFWHMANGRVMVESGRIIEKEVFSYTSYGEPFNNHEWLSQIILYLAFATGGANGLITLKVVITLAVSWLLFRTAGISGASPAISALLCLFLVNFALNRFLERPQLFSFLGLALLGFLLYGFRKEYFSGKVLYWLPVIMLLWDCLHGAMYGLLFMLFFVGGETIKHFISGRFPEWEGLRPMPGPQLRSLWKWSGITVFCMLLSPFGLMHYDVFINLINQQTEARYVEEFMPIPMTLKYLHFWLLPTFTALVLAWERRRIDITAGLVYLVFACLMIKYIRAVEAFVIVILPILASSAARLQAYLENRRPKPLVTGVVAAVTASGLLYVAYCKYPAKDPDQSAAKAKFYINYRTGVDENFYPVGSARFVKDAGLQGNMFNSDSFGGYLSYYLAPERRIFHYNHPTIFNHYFLFLQDESFRERFKINYAIVSDKRERNLFRDFTLVYSEPFAQVLVKNSPGNRRVIEQYRINYFDPQLTNEELTFLAGNPSTFPVITKEMAHYLSYRTDKRICILLSLLLRRPNNELPADERIRFVQLAKKYNTDNPELLATEGLLLYTEKKDLLGARDAFLAALRNNREMPWVRLNVAYIDLDLGKPGEAIPQFESLLMDNARDSNALYGLGLAYFSAGRKRDAFSTWNLYLKQDPNSPWAKNIRDMMSRNPAI